MTITLNEHEWAEEMINSRSLGQKPFETLSRVARYYIDKQYPKNEVRTLLDKFLSQCDPSASVPKWSDTLDRALTRALKTDAVVEDGIYITKPEMNKISQLPETQTRRLAFTLLCLAKYWKLVNPYCDYWVSNKDGEVMKLANISTSIKRQSLLYAKLADAGMIKFSKKIDNTNVQVRFVEDGATECIITDFRNLGHQYMWYTGSKDYIQCANCGLVVRKTHVVDKELSQRGRKQVYCRECAVKTNIYQKTFPVMNRALEGIKH